MGMLTFKNAGKKDASRMTTSNYVATPGQPVPWQNPNESVSQTVANASTSYNAGEFSGLGPTLTPYDAGEFSGLGPEKLVPRGTGPGRGKTGSRLNLLQFPKNLGIDEQPHYMMFTIHSIRGTVGATASDTSFSQSEGSVALPIPGNPSASYEQGWDTEEAGITMSSVIQGSQDMVAAYNEPTYETDRATGRRRQTGTGGIGAALGSIGDTAKDAYKTVTGMGVASILGKATGNRALGQSGGQAVFDQSFAVYGGPAYRTFSFQYSLMPLSKSDVVEIKRIVDFFKINSAPVSQAGAVARIYGLPKAFQIKYFNRGNENTYMNKIGKCALTSINVTYGGDRFTMFDGEDAPVQVNLSLSFKELQLQDSSTMAAGY